MSAEVIKIDGAPGVGKSHSLLEAVEKETRSGLALNDFYYLTFTRSGREDTEESLLDLFPDADSEDVMARARTFHGCAWIACALNDFWCGKDDVDQVIEQDTDDDLYRRYASQNGMRYVGETNPLQKLSEGQELNGTADDLYAISDWLSLERRPIEQFHMAPTQVSLPRTTVEEFLKGWEEFKRTGRPDEGEPLFEHPDYVDAAIDREYLPDARVLFIDEFQDLSPQEYLLYKTWRDSGEIDRIYIAGDSNQSIYSFRAGTPRYFEETPVDDVQMLKKSYRCPEAIAGVASGILRACEETDPNGFSARRSGGLVEEMRMDSPTDLAKLVSELASQHAAEGGVMLLTRANYQVRALSKALRNGGVPYEYLGSKSSLWQDPLPDLLDVLRRLQTEVGGISKQEVELLMSHAPRYDTRRRRLGPAPLGVHPASDVRAAFDEYDTVAEIVPSLSLENKYWNQMLKNVLETDSEVEPDSVRVGTIHSAKGLEAPAVLLFDGYTSGLNSRYTNGDIRAEEHRLYYVGATRASEELYVVRDYFNGPTAPPLPEPLPEGWEVAVQ